MRIPSDYAVAADRPDWRPSAAVCEILGSRRVGGGLATGALYPVIGLGFVACWGCIGAPWGCICVHWGCISGHWVWFRGLVGGCIPMAGWVLHSHRKPFGFVVRSGFSRKACGRGFPFR